MGHILLRHAVVVIILLEHIFIYMVCPGSSDPFYIVTYFIKWVTTSWTYSTTVCPRISNPLYVLNVQEVDTPLMQ